MHPKTKEYVEWILLLLLLCLALVFLCWAISLVFTRPHPIDYVVYPPNGTLRIINASTPA